MGESTQANSSSGLILHWLNSLESKATVVVHVAVSCFRQDKNPARMKAVLVTAITQLSLSVQVFSTAVLIGDTKNVQTETL